MEFVSAVVVAIAGVLLAQQPEDRIVLLPAPDGSVGKVIVQGADGTKQLDTANAALTVDEKGNTRNYREGGPAIEARYGELLAAQPPRPRNYVLYFLSGGTDLAPESQAELEAIKRDVVARPIPEVRVVGYTDTVGTAEANDALSQKRAESVVEFLRNAGVKAKTFEAVGRGERQLSVSTRDDVAASENRRVEILIR